ncbi:MAG: hypothetical protein WD969_05545 [Paracoccaceae bacterium]
MTAAIGSFVMRPAATPPSPLPAAGGRTLSRANAQRPLVTVHFGAHRTGSTSIQTALADYARAAGVGKIRMIGPDELRPDVTMIVNLLAAAPGLPFLATPLLLRWVAPSVHGALHAPGDSVVVSDEQFLGGQEQSLLEPRGLYPDARRRVEVVRWLLGGATPRAVLTVRPYADWFASAYAWTIVRAPLPEPRELAAQWARLPRGWPEVVRDIMAVFGACEVVDFATLRQRPRAVLRRLVGDAAADIEGRHDGRSLPARGVAEVLRRRAAGEPVDLGGLASLRRDFRQGRKFNPFTLDQRRALNARYQRDLDEIAALGAGIRRPRATPQAAPGEAPATITNPRTLN